MLLFFAGCLVGVVVGLVLMALVVAADESKDRPRLFKGETASAVARPKDQWVMARGDTATHTVDVR